MKKNKIKRYKMSDIASMAGVSITTVSHIINKTRYVSPEKTKKVTDLINKTGYRKSFSASSLRGKKTKLIGLIIPDVSNPIFGQLSKNIEDTFYKIGYNITMCNSNNIFEREIFYLEMLQSRDVDGVIVVPVKNEYKYLKNILQNMTPLIIIDREINNLDADFIMVDNYTGCYKATDYLIKVGHKKIGYIDRPYDLSHNIERFNGFKKALSDNGIEFDPGSYIRSKGFMYSDGYNAMQKIIALKDKPTALLGFDDTIIIGAMRAIKEAGYSVTDDFSVIGFDNHIINNYLMIALSTVEFPTKKISEKASELFLYRKENVNEPGIKIKLEAELIMRESVSKPKIS